jgi:hypothetical protein
MPTEVNATLLAPEFGCLTLGTGAVFRVGASIVVLFTPRSAEGLLLYVIAAFAIRFAETALVLSADAGTA